MRTKGAIGLKNTDGIGEMLKELDYMFIPFTEKENVKLMLKKAYNLGKIVEVRNQIEYERNQRVESAMKRIMDEKYVPKN